MKPITEEDIERAVTEAEEGAVSMLSEGVA